MIKNVIKLNNIKEEMEKKIAKLLPFFIVLTGVFFLIGFWGGILYLIFIK